MDIKSYFFNSRLVDGVQDRLYNSDDFCNYLDKIVGNGVFSNPSTNLQVTQTTTASMDVVVQAGQAWIQGHKIILEQNEILSIEASGASTYRKDRIVVACDYVNRNMRIYVKKGTAADSLANAVAPALIRNSNVYELGLAIINIIASQQTITSSSISDTRSDTSVCGFVSGLINQVDTTTLFQQYEASFQEMEAANQEEFEIWFENLQSTLVSNTVFIEKKATYTTTQPNETTIPIPASLLFGDALDVLHVYLNGFRLIEGVQYTKTSDTITFTTALQKAGTVIEITNWKTAGTTEVQEMVAEVEQLEEDMTNIKKYRYVCNNLTDNINIATIINNFYNGSDDFSDTTTYSQLHLEVVGKFTCNDSTALMTSDDMKNIIVVTAPSGTKKTVILDLSNATFNVTRTSGAADILDTLFKFIGNGGLTLVNPNISVTVSDKISNTGKIIETDGDIIGGRINVINNSESGIIGVSCTSTSSVQNIENIKTTIVGNSTSSNASSLIGFQGRSSYSDTALSIKFFNCYSDISTLANTHYQAIGFDGVGSFSGCSTNIYNRGTAEYSNATGFKNDEKSSLLNCECYIIGSRSVRGFDGNGKYANCKSHAASNGSYPCYGFYINGEASNCEGIGRNASNGGSGYGFFLKNNTATLKLVNCVGYGYKSIYSTASTVYAYGISANTNATTQSLVCIGCQVPEISRTNFQQSGSILIPGTTSGANATLVGNILYTAVQKHSGSNITEQGNIIG